MTPKERRAKWREEGKCSSRGCEIDNPRWKQCTSCRERNRPRVSEWRRRKAAKEQADA